MIKKTKKKNIKIYHKKERLFLKKLAMLLIARRLSSYSILGMTSLSKTVCHGGLICLMVSHDCQLNTNQQMTIIQRVLYLRMAYFTILATDLNQLISFKVCCENAIKKMSEIGINVIKNYKTIMQWNCIFCKH